MKTRRNKPKLISAHAWHRHQKLTAKLIKNPKPRYHL
jgi:hypothetical protein